MKKIIKKLKLLTPSVVLHYRDDEELMLLIKTDGNQQAFRVLVERYKARAMSYMVVYKMDRAINEDLIQDSFLKVFRYRERYNEQSKFSSWFWTILKNTTLDYLRKHKESLYNDFHNSSEDYESFDSQIPSKDMNPEEILLEASTAEQIKNCFNQLRSRERDILKTRMYFELSYEDIADKFQCSLSVVKNTIFRAKESMLNCLKECADG